MSPAGEAKGNVLKSVDLTDDDMGVSLDSLPTSRPSISTATYGRLVIPDILNQYETLLYIDGDTLFDEDVQELLCIKPKHLAAVEAALPGNKDMTFYDTNGLPMPRSYFNAGILLINTKYWIDNKISQRSIDIATDEKLVLPLHDQDALNIIFGTDYHRLDMRWNFMYPMSKHVQTIKPFVAHFAGQMRPWDDADWRCPDAFREHYTQLFASFPENSRSICAELMFPEEERAWLRSRKRTGLRALLKKSRRPRWNPDFDQALELWNK
jgi:lipopolysaccharide biosynthesis glycosyltransferase